MLKNIIFLLVVSISFKTIAQNTITNYNATLDSLKQQNNFSEFIYLQLDEFAKKPSVENLTIFEHISSNLWRIPSNKNEYTALLYYHINYAFHLKQFGYINKSIVQYEKAYSVYTTHTIKNYNIIEYCLKPLANNYTRLGDVDSAEDVLKITIEKAQIEGDQEQLIAGYSNLAIALRTKGNYNTAINYLKLGIHLATKKQLKSRLYSDLAINYLYLNTIEKAEENCKISNNLNIEKAPSIIFRNSNTIGLIFLRKKKLEDALVALNTALKTAIIVFGKNDREVAKIHNRMAEVYKEQQQFNKALNSYQKSLSTLLPKYHPVSKYDNPSNSYFYPENTLKVAFDGIAGIFLQINDFENALKNYELAFKVEDELRASFLSQNAKIIQQQETRNSSEKCIDVCYQLYQQSNNIHWVEKAFQFAEQSKSVVLLEAKEASFKKATIKHDSLFLIEKELLFKKAQLNKSITLEALKGEKASVNLLANFTNQRTRISNKLQLLKHEIQLKYPTLKVQQDSLITFKNIEKQLLQSNEQLIEFFDGKKQVYIFSIVPGATPTLNKIIKNTSFETQILDFLSLFADNRGTDLQNNIQKYTSLGYQLYQKIVPVKLNKKVIIVPDGLFTFLPFDALITETTSIANFEKLPYLVKKNSISYAYSASILLHNNNIKENTKHRFIGFFPIFENNYRSLTELNFTQQEASNIHKSIDGTFLVKQQATKEAFNKLAKNYDMIHLSTHATSGDFYTPPAIEFYNKTLYLPEIYGYNLETDLLVLSACETGLGTLRKGEGAMSLARGFSYAGVKNLLVSLWKVNDKSTQILMSEFYKNYEKTGNKAAALQHSKLAYLENSTIAANKKSPYYWASFIYIGDVTSLENNHYNFMWSLILGFVLLVGYFLLKKR
jgi:CHAT domain-containing protein